MWQANRFLKASALTAWGLIGVDIDTRRCDCQNVVDMVCYIFNTYKKTFQQRLNSRTNGSVPLSIKSKKKNTFDV